MARGLANAAWKELAPRRQSALRSDSSRQRTVQAKDGPHPGRRRARRHLPGPSPRIRSGRGEPRHAQGLRDGRRGLNQAKVEHAGRRARRAHALAGPGRLLGPQRGLAPGAAGRRARPRPRLARRARAEAPGPGAARGRGRPPRRGGAGAGGPRARALGRADPGGRRRRRRVGGGRLHDLRLRVDRGRPAPRALPRLPVSCHGRRAAARLALPAGPRRRARDGAPRPHAQHGRAPRLHGRADEADPGQAGRGAGPRRGPVRRRRATARSSTARRRRAPSASSSATATPSLPRTLRSRASRSSNPAAAARARRCTAAARAARARSASTPSC